MSIFKEDQIVYVVMTKGGGMDGMDRNDKPKAKFASFERKEAEKRLDAWSDLKLVALSADELVLKRNEALQKLDGIEQLLLETHYVEKSNRAKQ